MQTGSQRQVCCCLDRPGAQRVVRGGAVTQQGAMLSSLSKIKFLTMDSPGGYDWSVGFSFSPFPVPACHVPPSSAHLHLFSQNGNIWVFYPAFLYFLNLLLLMSLYFTSIS